MRIGKLKLKRFDYACFLAFIAYAASSVILPMTLIEIGRELNFPLAAGGMGSGGALQIGRSLPMIAAMLLSGFLAGRFGKLRSMGWALLLMGGGIALAALADHYMMLFAAVLFAGLGEGVIEALATPVVQDMHPRDSGKYMNFTHGFWSVGVLGSVLLAGVLLTKGISWRYIVGAVVVLAASPALFFLLPSRRIPASLLKTEAPVPMKLVWMRSKELIAIPRFWLFFAAMFVAGGGEFCLTFWLPSYIRMEFSGATAITGGIGTALFAGGMIVGRLGWGMLIPQSKLKMLIFCSAVTGGILALPLMWSAAMSAWVIAVLFLVGVATGPFWPSLQSYCADRIECDSTVLFILLSCAGVPGCGVFTWLMGLCADRFGLRQSFLLVVFCYGTLAILMGIDHFLKGRVAAGGREVNHVA
ncbi:MAG: MFS transporter [Victivallaceae bacterium]|nr:MFS transporter [Victivallaceae bacterium]